MEAIIFDIDGTLTETNEVDTTCYLRAARELLAVTTIDPDWNNYPHATDPGVLEELYRRHRGTAPTALEQAAFEERFLALLKEQPDHAYLALPGAAAFLSLMCRAGHAVGIATGCWHSSARLKLDRGHIPFEEIPLATASKASGREEIMRIAHDRLLQRHAQTSFDRVLYFGDAPWDVEATSQLGWELVGIGRNVSLLRKLHVAQTFADYEDHKAILKALCL